MLNLFFHHYSFMIVLLICAGVDVILVSLWVKNKTEKLFDFALRVVCSNFLLAYVGFHIFQRVLFYKLHPNLHTFFSWLNWALVMMIILFFMISYFTRTPPVKRARGFKEIIFPVICAAMPLGLIEMVAWTQGSKILLWIFKPFYIQSPSYWNPYSIILLSIGHLIIMLGIVKLRRSFSVMAEARSMVSSGIYKWIRHPLYLGETLSIIGLCFLAPSWFNIGLTSAFTVLQWYRAKIEERKLAASFPAYKEYQGKTGMYFPVWSK